MEKTHRKRKKSRVIKVGMDENPPILFDEKTEKFYPVSRMPKGFRFGKPFKK